MANIMNRLQKLWNPDDDYYYDDEENFDGEDIESYSNQEEQEPERQRSSYRSRQSQQSQPAGRVVNVNQKTKLDVVIFKPTSFNKDTTDIAQTLMSSNAVILNLERTDPSESRRILDFLSGITFARDGKIKQVATSTYIITPSNVGLSGQEILEEFEDSIYF